MANVCGAIVGPLMICDGNGALNLQLLFGRWWKRNYNYHLIVD